MRGGVAYYVQLEESEREREQHCVNVMDVSPALLGQNT